jgi:hypothetical protein
MADMYHFHAILKYYFNAHTSFSDLPHLEQSCDEIDGALFAKLFQVR